MNIAEIIATDRISTATDVHSRKRALQRLSELLAEGAPYLTAGEIFNALIAREKLGSTGIGNGIAIPHARMKGIDESLGALVRIPGGVDFEADDGQPVDLILGLLVPEQSATTQPSILHALTKALGNAQCQTALRHVNDNAALLDTFVKYSPSTPNSSG